MMREGASAHKRFMRAKEWRELLIELGLDLTG